MQCIYLNSTRYTEINQCSFTGQYATSKSVSEDLLSCTPGKDSSHIALRKFIEGRRYAASPVTMTIGSNKRCSPGQPARNKPELNY